MKLYIGNLAWAATESDLEAFFDPYQVKAASCKIIRDKETGRSRGYGFIEVTDGDTAIADLNGKELLSRPVKINVANQQQSNNSSPKRY